MPFEETKKVSNFAITGPRGAGKSTVVRRILERIGWLRFAFFATERLVEEGRHVGFLVVTPGGGRWVFARQDWLGPLRRGRWGYDPAIFDHISGDLRHALEAYDALAFDEIGFMEDQAGEFRRALKVWLDSDKPVLLALKQSPRADTVTWILNGASVKVWRLPECPPEQVVGEVVRLLEGYRGSGR